MNSLKQRWIEFFLQIGFGAAQQILATLAEQARIITILAYLDNKCVIAADSLLPDCRASPGA